MRIREKLEGLYRAYLNPVLLDENGKPIKFNREWYHRNMTEEEMEEQRKMIDKAYGVGVPTGLRGLLCIEIDETHFIYTFYESMLSALFMTKRVSRRNMLPISYLIFFYVPLDLVERVELASGWTGAKLYRREVVPVYAVTREWLMVSCSLINPWETYYDFTPNLERINSALELLGLRLKV